MKFEIYGKREGLLRKRVWRWRFRAANYEIIAQGEPYNNKGDCQRAVSILKEYASGARVKDLGEEVSG